MMATRVTKEPAQVARPETVVQERLRVPVMAPVEPTQAQPAQAATALARQAVVELTERAEQEQHLALVVPMERTVA